MFFTAIRKKHLVPVLLAAVFVSAFSGCSASENDGSVRPPPSQVSSAQPTPEIPPETSVSPSPPAESSPVESEPAATPEATMPPELTLEEKILSEMTLEDKVGQMILADCPSYDAEEIVREYAPGGYLMFATFFRDLSPDEAKKKIADIQSASAIPMFIAVDEEGGTVNRVSLFPQYRAAAFQSPRTLFSTGGFELIESDAVEKSRLLLSLGINLNLSPVCDISGEANDFIYKRAMSGDPDEVASFAELVVTVMREQGIGSALKHFPGYGNNGDTHTQTVHDKREYGTFLERDFLPFIAGINAGANCVLVSHNIVECMDPEYPASLSTKVNRILRDYIGFDGVVITDSLSMDAVAPYSEDTHVAVLAIEAGNDLICCSDITDVIPAVLDAVMSGRIPEDRIDASVLRILRMKMELGLIDNIES